MARLVVANEELEAEKHALADALANISHQLRTPLTSLGIELELMRKAAATPEDAQRVLDCGRMLEQLQWLVSSLLKLARLDAGVVRLERHRVDVSSLVKAAQEPLAVTADLAGVTFQAKVEPDCSFMGDAAWTREALTNVLKNCVEHTPAGGAVSITAHEDAVACRIRMRTPDQALPRRTCPTSSSASTTARATPPAATRTRATPAAWALASRSRARCLWPRAPRSRHPTQAPPAEPALTWSFPR